MNERLGNAIAFVGGLLVVAAVVSGRRFYVTQTGWFGWT